MRRWNGWGECKISLPLPDIAETYLAQLIGPGQSLLDAILDDVVNTVPQSSIPENSLISTNALDRVLHARGQSLPDWIAMRSGQIKSFPDGVAFPQQPDEIRQLLDYAQTYNVAIIPYGGGTSVVGHINPIPEFGPSLTVDLSRMKRLIELDEINLLANFEAGVTGPELEMQLQQHGYTLGHFPQSFEYSTLGGWIASRSTGQQSIYYGRIDNLLAGGRLETPIGTFSLPPYPASAAGPDLRQILSGSEGRLGIIVSAVIRIRKIPEYENFFGALFPNWEAGILAIQQISQERIPVSMMRLSDADETETMLRLSGQYSLVARVNPVLEALKYGKNRCLLIFGITGKNREIGLIKSQAGRIIRQHGGLNAGTMIGKSWKKSRFTTPYLRNTLWEHGYALDTLETALAWDQILPATHAIKQALVNGLSTQTEIVFSFAHLSHTYPDGASLYITYLFRRPSDPEQTLEYWKILKRSASVLIQEHGGTISHQHGVGIDHLPYMDNEKGILGTGLIEAIINCLDPKRVMNPGKLV